jgi:hypothetical protein
MYGRRADVSARRESATATGSFGSVLALSGAVHTYPVGAIAYQPAVHPSVPADDDAAETTAPARRYPSTFPVDDGFAKTFVSNARAARRAGKRASVDAIVGDADPDAATDGADEAAPDADAS